MSGAAVNLKSSGGVWRDHKYGVATESTTTQNQFRTFTNTTYGGNVRTNAHGVSKLELPGIGSYNEVNLPTTPEDDRDSGRQLIEPRNPFKWNNSTGTWDATTDSPATRELKTARKAGLYILVNPDNDTRTACRRHRPTHFAPLLPLVAEHHQWRWHPSPPRSSAAPASPPTATMTAAPPVRRLLMADDTMYSNVLPNRYTTGTVVGSNQVLRIPRPSITWAATISSTIAGGYAIGATDLALDTGTGLIHAGMIRL